MLSVEERDRRDGLRRPPFRRLWRPAPRLLVLGATLAAEEGALPLRVVRHVRYASGWLHIATRSDRPILGRLFARFVGADGRERIVAEINEEIRDAVGPMVPKELEPLMLSAEEAEQIAAYERLRVGALASLPLLNGVTADGSHTGVASEMSKYIAYELGLPLEIVPYETLDAMLADAEAGEIDLVPLPAVSAAREKRLVFSEPYFETAWVAIGRAGERRAPRERTPGGWPRGSLSGRRLGLRADHPLREIVTLARPDLEIVDVASPRAALEALVDGEIDATLLARPVALPLIDEPFAAGLRVMGSVEEPPARFAFAVPRGRAELIPLIDRALGQLDPALAARMVRRWTAVDFEPLARLRRYLKVLVPLALATLALLFVFWNRSLRAENRRRLRAEQRLIDMTEGLRTGVFQLRQRDGKPERFELANGLAKRMARIPPEGGGIDSIKAFFPHIHPDERERVAGCMQASLDSGGSFREAFRFALPVRPDRGSSSQREPQRPAPGQGGIHREGRPRAPDPGAERRARARVARRRRARRDAAQAARRGAAGGRRPRGADRGPPRARSHGRPRAASRGAPRRAARASRVRRAGLRRGDGGEGARVLLPDRSAGAAAGSRRSAASQADPLQPDRQRREVHRPRQHLALGVSRRARPTRSARRSAGCGLGDDGGHATGHRHRGRRQRYRHTCRPSDEDLRAVLDGRAPFPSQHRSRSRDLPSPDLGDGRQDPRRIGAGGGLDLPRAAAARADRGDGGGSRGRGRGAQESDLATSRPAALRDVPAERSEELRDRVLLVDDDRFVRVTLASLPRQAGCTVVEAGDALQIRRAIRDARATKGSSTPPSDPPLLTPTAS